MLCRFPVDKTIFIKSACKTVESRMNFIGFNRESSGTDLFLQIYLEQNLQ